MVAVVLSRGPSRALWEVWKYIWLYCVFGSLNWSLKRIWLRYIFWYFCCRSGWYSYKLYVKL